jgi:hypothetical protein
MTNHYSIVDGSDGEPTVAHKELRIRGYWSTEMKSIIREHGWEEAARRLCRYCGKYIHEHDDLDEPPVEDRWVCNCDEENRQPAHPNAPV